MQPNTITLPVDILNNGTLTNTDYLRFEEYQNRAVYIGVGHTLTSRNTLSLYRTMPKVSGNFRGTAKTAVKFSLDIQVLGVDNTLIVGPSIVEVSFSIPVGATTAHTVEQRQKAIALLDQDAIMNSLNDLLMI